MKGKNGAHRWFGIVAAVVLLAIAWTTKLKRPVQLMLTGVAFVMLISHWEPINSQFKALGRNL